MIDFASLFQKPAENPTPEQLDVWFERIAQRLLCESRVMIAEKPHRYVEVEIYYYQKEHHPDIFAHKDPVQLEMGRWYFHRTRGEYRAGSFKGLDLSFGDGDAYGGVLLRGIEKPDGTLIDGPSLHVDYLLEMTGHSKVPNLDEAINERVAWEEGNPIELVPIEEVEDREIIRTARVGLTLKRSRKSPLPPQYVLKPYRFLTEPRRTKKGKLHMILGLHAAGKSLEEIKEITGSTKNTIQRYVDDFEAGRDEEDFSSYYGKDLKSKDLCRMHGTWYAHYGSTD